MTLPSSYEKYINMLANRLFSDMVTDEYDSETSELDREYIHNLNDVIVSATDFARETHKPVLDLDIPAYLIPSSTSGHSHLYINIDIPWRRYRKLLRELKRCGIIEPGYYKASVHRRATRVRLPWIKKTFYDNKGNKVEE
jgi:hypothetical protein